MKYFLKASVRHTLFLFFEVVAIVAAVLLLAWGGLLVRLEKGPLDLRFISAQMEELLNANLTQYQIEFENIQLAGGGFKKPVEIQLENIQISDAQDNNRLAAVSKIGMDLSKTALLTGDIAPSALNFYDISLKASINEDGGFRVNIHRKGEDVETENENLLKVLREGFYGENQDSNLPSALRYLNVIRVVNADLSFKHPELENNILLENADIVVKRHQKNTTATLDGNLNLLPNSQGTPAKGYIYYNPETDENALSLHFSDLEVDDLRRILPGDLHDRMILTGDLRGTLNTEFDRNFQIGNTDIEGTLQNGVFNFEKTFASSLSFDRIDVTAQYNRQTGFFKLDNLQVEKGDSKLVMAADMTKEAAGDENILQVTGKLNQLNVADLPQYWPQNILASARKWVAENITQGQITDLEFNTAANIRQATDVDLESFNSHFNVSNLSLKYLPDMPLVQVENATAVLTDSEIAFENITGKSLDAAFTKGSVQIPFVEQPIINISFNADAPLKTLFDVTNRDPIALNDKVNLPYKNISGVVQGDVQLLVPIGGGANDPVDYKIKAQGHNVAWKHVYKDINLTRGKIKMVLDNSKFALDGDMMLDDQPSKFSYMKKMNALADVLDVQSALPAQKIIPADVQDVAKVEGIVPLHVIKKQIDPTSSEMQISANLSAAYLAFKDLNVVKPMGVPADFSALVKLSENRIDALNDLRLASAPISLQGNVSLSDGEWHTAEFKNILYAGNDFDVSAENKPRAMTARVQGRYFDLSPYLKNAGDMDQTMERAGESAWQKPIKVSAQVSQLKLSERGVLKNSKAYLERSESKKIYQMELDGIAGNGALYYRYLPDELGRHSLRVEADDAGSALEILGVTKSISGGTLVVDAKPEEADSTYNMKGRFKLSDFVVRDAPAFARLINGLSMRGLSDLMAGQGIQFRTLDANFLWRDGINNVTGQSMKMLTVNDGRTTGASIGLTFDGNLNVTDQKIDMNGNIVPLSGLNRAVGDIPVLGDLLTGGGDGVFAATYKVDGNIKDPRVVVNPLAALAPGFLRDIFFEQ